LLRGMAGREEKPRRMTFFEQAIGLVATLVCVAGFVWALVLYSRAGRWARAAAVVVSWVLAIVLYRVAFFGLPEDSELGWIAFMGLTFVFAFAFWGVIDLAIHSNVRLRGGEAARFAQGVALLVLSAALFVAAYFLPDALGALLPGAGFGAYFLGILGGALAAILCFRAGARAVYANRAAVPGLLAARKATAEAVPEKVAYMLGETAHAAVRISGRRDFEVSDTRAELLYTSRYSYLTFDPRGGSLFVDESDRVVVDTEHLQTGETIRKGKAFEHRVSLRLPTDAPPTGEGEITGVAWTIGVVLDLRVGWTWSTKPT
jgi:putative intracellular protease/amidase